MIFCLVFNIFQRVQQIFLDIFPGFITQQTIAAGDFVVGVLIASPFLILVALFVWAVVRQSTDTGGAY